MAKKINNIAEVKVYINGKEQAKRDLDELRKKAEEFKNEIDALKKKKEGLAEATKTDPTKVVEFDETRKQIEQLERDHKKLQKVIRETENFARDIEEDLQNLSGVSLARLKQIERSLSAIRQRLSPEEDKDGTFLQYLNEQITRVVETMKNKKGDIIEFKDIMDDLANIDDASLAKAEQRLKSLIAATDKDDVERLKQLNAELAKIQGEGKRRLGVQAKQIMGGDYTKTIEGTKQAIEVLKKYQSTLDATDTKAINEVESAIKRMSGELDKAQRASARKTLTADLATAGTVDIKQAIDLLTKYQGTLKPLSPLWEKINKEIEAGNNRLKELSDGTKMDAMAEQFKKYKNLSVNALAEQKKYWTEVKNTHAETDKEYKRAIGRLEKIDQLEKSRTKTEATKYITEATGGTWDKTIEETQQAIKLIEEYKKQLKTSTDADAIEEANKAIEILNGNLGKTKESLMGIDEAKRIADAIGTGKFDGTIEEIEKAKKALEAYRKTLKEKTDAKEIKKVEESLRNVSNHAEQAKKKIVDVNDVLGRLDSASVEDLEAAAKQLQDQLISAQREGGNYANLAADLRKVNLELKQAKKEWEGQENVIKRTAKRLMAYVAVYGGWNEVWGRTKELYKANLELSDSLADIQKTTGLSAQAVGKLSDQINAIDTRTAQKELHDLAYEAGKLGISAEEDIMAFVKAGNQLLVALGEDLGGAEAVRSLMKVNAILGETEKLGVEKALLSTGSAINEISQTSRASAGPIADMVSRMGAIGAAAGLSMSDLIALAGTADALGQSSEVAATAFNKFISTLKSNPVDVAFALGMNSDVVQRMLETGRTMEVIQQIFERMSTMGDMEALAPIMGDLGSEGARMTQVLVTMAKGFGELNAQLYTSRKAFKDATSVTNEYNIKNESAAAIVQRMGNNLRESFVQSKFVSWIKEVLQWLYYLPQRINENRAALLAWKVLMWEIVMVTGAKFVTFLSINVVGAFKAVVEAINMAIAAQAKLKWGNNAADMLKAASAVGKLKLAFQALWTVIKANPFTALIALLGVVIGAYQTFRKEATLLKKAEAELNTTIQNEQRALRDLRTKIDRANSATGERASLIKKLNDKYGSYLGFLVTESNYIENQAYIYDLLNAKIRENVALKMEEKMTDQIVEKHAANKMDANAKIQTALRGISTIGEGGAPAAMEDIFAEIAKQVESGVEDVDLIVRKIVKDLPEKIQQDLNQVYADESAGKISTAVAAKRISAISSQGDFIAKLRSGIRESLEIEMKMSKDIADAQEIIQSNQNAMKKRSEDITRKQLETQFANLKADASADQLQTLQSQTENYIKQQQTVIDELNSKKVALSGLSYEEERRYKQLTEQIYGVADANGEVEKRERESLRTTADLQAEWNALNAKKNRTVELSEEEEEALANAIAEVDKWNKALEPVNKKLISISGINIWGTPEEKDLAMNSPQQLVNMWNKLEADAKRLSEASFKNVGEWVNKGGKQMATQFWRKFETRDQAVSWYIEQKDAIAAQLKKLGYSTSGNFLTGGGDGSEKKTANQMYKEWLDELEAYYNEREALIRQNGMKEKKLETEINRELEALNTEKLTMQRELEEGLLSDLYEGSTFDPSKFEGVITKTKYFANLTLEQMRAIVAAGGPKLEAEIRKNMTDRMVKIEEQAYKIKQRIEKILLEDDFSEKVAKEYMDSLNELGLLFNIKTEAQIKQTEAEGERRLAYMREWAKESYAIDAAELERNIKSNELFSEWIKDRKPKDYKALLSQLRKFHDDETEAEKRHADRMKKLATERFKSSGQQSESEERIYDAETKLSSAERLEKFGIGGEQVINDYEIELIKQKIAAEEQWLALLAVEAETKKKMLETDIANAKKRLEAEQNEDKRREIQDEIRKLEQDLVFEQNAFTAASEESINKMLELQADASEKYINKFTVYFDHLKSFQDNIDTFAQSMGEGIFGSKEDRQQAAKDLLVSVATTGKNMLQMWLTQLATRRLIDDMEVEQTRATEMRKQAIKLQSMVQDGTIAITGLSVQEAIAKAENLMDISRGIGKEVAKKGIIGLVIGAGISAALSALLGAATGRVKQAKDEIASATGAGRKLSTGMLTYAEGNYPVLGNDGKVYDAKYEGAGMKTGVYGGGAHFGIFSEKQPEMIVDGKTTQKIILNYPYIYDAITTIAKNGRLKNAMPTFAAGDYPAGLKQIAQVQTADASPAASNEQMERMAAALEQSQAVNSQLLKLLQGGITAHLDGLETHRQQKKNERFLKRRGID